MQADYARTYRTLWERHWWWRSRESLLLATLRSLHRRGGGQPLRALDVGCGDGLFFEQLSRFGSVEGLEPDGSLVADPRWKGRITVGRLGEFRPGPVYDLVLMLDVLEHIDDDAAALREVCALLKPGGVLLLTVPALSWLWSRHDEVNEHCRRYDRRGLARVLREAGFRVDTLRYFFAWAVGPLVVRRWLNPAGSRRVRADYAVRVPPAPVNRALDLLSRAEHAAGRVARWPLGSSLLAVAVVPRGS